MRLWAKFFLLGLLTQTAIAAEPKREWKAIPGHKNILLDMASIKPLKKEFFEFHLPSGWTHDKSRPYEITHVAIRLNGHLDEDFPVYCSGMVLKGGVTVGNAGHVPEGVVDAIVCPKARTMMRKER